MNVASPGVRLEHLGLDVDIDRALDDLRRSFPSLCFWYGDFSGSLWALGFVRVAELLCRR